MHSCIHAFMHCICLYSAASVASQDSRRDVTRICDPVVVASDGPSPLTPEMIKQFHTRGYIIVRNLVSENDCSKVQRACERLVDTEANELTNADPPLIADAKTDSPFSRRLFDLFCEAGMDKAPLLFRKVGHCNFVVVAIAVVLHIIYESNHGPHDEPPILQGTAQGWVRGNFLQRSAHLRRSAAPPRGPPLMSKPDLTHEPHNFVTESRVIP